MIPPKQTVLTNEALPTEAGFFRAISSPDHVELILKWIQSLKKKSHAEAQREYPV